MIGCLVRLNTNIVIINVIVDSAFYDDGRGFVLTAFLTLCNTQLSGRIGN